MRCLRCAGAPRRPARGSALYLLDPSQHVDLYVPGEPVAAYIQFLRDTHLPSPEAKRLGTLDVNRFRGLLVHHCYDLLSCSPPFTETFTSGLSTVRSPSPLPDMTTVATGRFHRRVFHPLDLQLASLHWIRAFAGHSVLTCRPLRPRGVRRRSVPGSDVDIGLRRLVTGSALPTFPQSVSRGGSISWLQWFAHCYGLPGCLPPLNGSDRITPALPPGQARAQSFGRREPRAGGVDRLGIALVRVPEVRSAVSAHLSAKPDRLPTMSRARLRRSPPRAASG